MTGFGKSVKEMPGKKVTVEVKSLNSKQADIAVRIPSSLRHHELAMRAALAEALVRGKIDLTVTIETLGTSETSQTLNVPVMEAYMKQMKEACAVLGIPEPADWYGMLVRFPDVLHSSATTADELTDEEAAVALETLLEAAKALSAHRRAEGEKLEQFFAERIKRIADLLAQVPQYEGERIDRIRARMDEALAKISGIEIDPGRLEQELFFYVEKFDITEEKQRLAQHLSYFIDTMAAEGAQGK
ncbi:MAG: DUF1732 domain-containing protein, partial [Duncaniella sp.]|nr:DUF1732 domain-containing protein [Duncaniella sp.]